MSPRLRRTAIIVFLAIFLGGISGTGAWALWSQSAAATATVQIGAWEWEHPLDVGCEKNIFGNCRADWKLWGEGKLKFSWQPKEHMNQNAASAYIVRLTQTSGSYDSKELTVRADKAAHDFTVQRWSSSDSYTLSIVPVTADGIRGKSISRCVELRGAFRMSYTITTC